MRTFVVKVWVPAGGEPPEELRGTVFDVSAGTERTFTGQADLIAALRGGADEWQTERWRGDEGVG
ncbi:MAG TPA: hypothetical protein VKE25_11455 [Actinomycetes bacterium]|nr:hypothetical protein [Actinomycetes bacterium]